MKAVSSTRSLTARDALTFLPCALAITLFLFYTDEGAYTLSWADLQQNRWILLGYVSGIFAAQLFLAYLLKGYRALVRVPLVLVLSIPLGIVLLFGTMLLFFALSNLF